MRKAQQRRHPVVSQLHRLSPDIDSIGVGTPDPSRRGLPLITCPGARICGTEKIHCGTVMMGLRRELHVPGVSGYG